jgi:hypothetical protein
MIFDRDKYYKMHPRVEAEFKKPVEWHRKIFCEFDELPKRLQKRLKFVDSGEEITTLFVIGINLPVEITLLKMPDYVRIIEINYYNPIKKTIESRVENLENELKQLKELLQVK